MKVRALLALAVLILAGSCREKPDPRPEALKQQLAAMRGAIRSFQAENGRYPGSLEELVPKYLPAVPNDPFTNAKTWRTITEETVQPSSDFQTAGAAAPAAVVIDVQSGAPGADASGTPYANY